MSDQILKPTHSEMEILQILWKNGSSSVKEVNTILGEKKPRGYTTTLKIMQIMAEKGLLSREANGKLHVYTPTISEYKTKSTVLNSMVDQVYEGAAMQMVIQALGNYRPNEDEINELKALIAKFEQTK
ncbi:MAG: BlaI/MecI/CopY family transcriptional regulator [Saprospiraceae bacterium]|nr:BlaI/MecI/CopY family transcriptional regulator [Saprospiraceae bacterium]